MQVLTVMCCYSAFVFGKGCLLIHGQVAAIQGCSPTRRSSANNVHSFPQVPLHSAPPPSSTSHPSPPPALGCLPLADVGCPPFARALRREASWGILTSGTSVKGREMGKSWEKGRCGKSSYRVSPIPGRESEISSFYKPLGCARRPLLHTLCRDDLSKSWRLSFPGD